MTESLAITPRTTLNPPELDALGALAAACQAAQPLDLRLNWDGLRARAGAAISDWLAYRGDELVGFLTADGLGDEEAEATGMVYPGARRQGVFSALVAALRDEARRRGTQRLVFYCDRRSDAARAFLEHAGAALSHAEHLMCLPAPPASIPQTALHVRTAGPEDAPAISQVLATQWGSDNVARQQRLAREIAQESLRYYLATRDGTPVATLNVQMINEQPYIYALVVDKAQRGRGYGRQFLARVVADVAVQHGGPLLLEVDTENAPALRLYRSLGFETVTTYDYWMIAVDDITERVSAEHRA